MTIHSCHSLTSIASSKIYRLIQNLDMQFSFYISTPAKTKITQNTFWELTAPSDPYSCALTGDNVSKYFENVNNQNIFYMAHSKM